MNIKKKKDNKYHAFPSPSHHTFPHLSLSITYCPVSFIHHLHPFLLVQKVP
ncbi:hypothetical protein BofuT4_uP005110.1 [Botrytis cinerea T4]|uniref:Uncharacterized protein n=1 Tax=Botryotinia fuckeliana (strain T4) TaxID=999810 RepID=G2Y3W2_BOTF4|nr:hypothetical protein BofuT4_uP005110.1 [Botrytis cinerea T4]